MLQRNVLVWNSELGRFQDRRFGDLRGRLIPPRSIEESRLSRLKKRLRIKEWSGPPGPLNELIAHEMRQHKQKRPRWAKILWWRKNNRPLSPESLPSNSGVLTYSKLSFAAGREVLKVEVAPQILEPEGTADVEESDAARRVREWAVREEMARDMMRREMVPLIC